MTTMTTKTTTSKKNKSFDDFKITSPTPASDKKGKAKKVMLRDEDEGVGKKPFKIETLPFKPNDYQMRAFEVIDDGIDLTIVWTTGTGKTLVAQYLAQKMKDAGKKTVLGLPLKALVEEFVETFGEYFNVLPVSGDYTENKKKVKDSGHEVFLMTYEMLFQYVVMPYNRSFFDDIGAVVIDEAHLIADKSRGFKVEVLLHLVKKFFPHIQILLMSATIKNFEEFANHFKSAVIHVPESQRPIPLKKSVAVYRKVYDKRQKLEIMKANVDYIIKMFGGPSKLPPTIFFCTSREITNVIAEHINTNDEYRDSGIKAIAHNAGKKKDVRVEIEKGFREGKFRVVSSTTTLAMGINMPCVVSVVLGVSIYDYLLSKEMLFDPNIIIQMMGRAGRRGWGYDDASYAFVFCEPEYQAHIQTVINRPMEVYTRIVRESPDDKNNLDYALLSVIVAGVKNEDEVKDFYQQILAKETPRVDVYESMMNWLKENEFYGTDIHGIYPTELGYNTIKVSVSPPIALQFYHLKSVLENTAEELTYPQIYAFMMANDESIGRVSVRGTSKTDALALNNADQFIDIGSLLRIADGDEYFDEFFRKYTPIIQKMFSMTYHKYLETFCNVERVPVSDNDLYILRDLSGRMVFACNTIIKDNWKYKKDIELINKGVQMETPMFDEKLLGIMRIKGVGIKTAMTLQSVGINSIADFIKADTKKLHDMIAEKIESQSDEDDESGVPKCISVSEKVLGKFKSEAFAIDQDDD